MIHIDTNKCIGCGACVKDCLRKSIEIKKGKAVFYNRNCIQCGHCFAVCPVKAIDIGNHTEESEEIQDDIFSIDASQLLHSLKRRRSVRQFQKRKVEKNVLKTLLEAGKSAPTARNCQEIFYVVIQKQIDVFRRLLWEAFEETVSYNLSHHIDEENNQRYLENCKKYKNNPCWDTDTFTYMAPMMIAVCGDFGCGIGRDLINVDAGLAVANIEHMANIHGLGMFCCGQVSMTAKNDEIRKFLHLEEKQELILALGIGYPAESLMYYRTAPRKSVSVIWK